MFIMQKNIDSKYIILKKGLISINVRQCTLFLHPGLVYWDLILPMFVPSATNIDHDIP